MRVTHARLRPRRSASVASWWGRAWLRAVEEAAFGETDLRAGRAAARRGDVGAITLDAGSLLAAVREGDEAWTVTVDLPALDAVEVDALVEVVAAQASRLPALLAGELPHDLVEHAEEAGVELLPYGGELGAACTCPAPLDPCAHALAVLTQVGWLVDADPLVLFAVRGLDRETLLARGRAPAPAPEIGAPVGDVVDDVEIAAAAVLRSREILARVEAGELVPDHWW